MQKDGIKNHIRKFIENQYSLEPNSGWKFINWIETQPDLNEELLQEVLTKFEAQPPQTLPTSSTFLRQRYLAKVKKAQPLPIPQCPYCGDRFETKDLEEHAPYCSYYRVVICKKDIFINGGNDFETRPLTEEIKADIYDRMMTKYLARDEQGEQQWE